MSLLDVYIHSKTFSIGKRSVSVLSNIKFSAEKGEFISIIGPSGSGKSTILKIIAGLQRLPTNKDILISGATNS